MWNNVEKFTPQKVALTAKENLLTMVEHRQSFDIEEAQLNIFETHTQAERVQLSFSDLVLTSMLRGKKVMHLPEKKSFDYLPGESVLVPGNEIMEIDFPEADEANPTQCLALVISREKVADTLERLNTRYPKVMRGAEWQVNEQYFHLCNNLNLSNSLSQLIHVSLHDHSREKGTIAQLKVEEILIRLMQTQARALLEHEYRNLGNHPFAAVVAYIKDNLHEKITVDLLCKKACMSKANFYRKFTEEFGISPASYIQQERLKKAKYLLHYSNMNVTDVAFATGFQNLAHFVTFFKKETGVTPKQFA
jgi:AraC-like DNA-binding protein